MWITIRTQIPGRGTMVRVRFPRSPRTSNPKRATLIKSWSCGHRFIKIRDLRPKSQDAIKGKRCLLASPNTSRKARHRMNRSITTCHSFVCPFPFSRTRGGWYRSWEGLRWVGNVGKRTREVRSFKTRSHQAKPLQEAKYQLSSEKKKKGMPSEREVSFALPRAQCHFFGPLPLSLSRLRSQQRLN